VRQRGHDHRVEARVGHGVHLVGVGGVEDEAVGELA
jgi:hypothetical protein